jgi:DNA-binding MarR family transcriptional regulator
VAGRRADPAPSSTVDVVRFSSAIAALVRVTRRDLHLPLGASTLAALRTVADDGPLRTGDLARHEGVAAPTLSRIVATLEGDGLVRREPDPLDRRVMWLEATAAGRELLDEVTAARARVFAERVARLSPEQSRRLADALDSLDALASD